MPLSGSPSLSRDPYSQLTSNYTQKWNITLHTIHKLSICEVQTSDFSEVNRACRVWSRSSEYETIKGVSRVYDVLGGQADGVDLISEGDGFLHMQQSDVSVQILFPVIFRMDDDFINSHDFLYASLISNITDTIKQRKSYKKWPNDLYHRGISEHQDQHQHRALCKNYKK